MKTKEELKRLLDFISEYATCLMGSGVHTSRVVRCSQRVGVSQDVEVNFTTFQKSMVMSVRDQENGEVTTRVVAIPALPINFHLNADLGTLSWEAIDEGLGLEEIRRRYALARKKAPINPKLTLAMVSLANASFCKLFGGDPMAVVVVLVATLLGFSLKAQLQKQGVNHFINFMISAFVTSFVASASLWLHCSHEIALATSVLFLVPGVPLINGVVDIVEGHVLIGFSRLVNALLLILCLAIGLSATLLMIKDNLL
ncbi:MAG TPA: threonine/serine exporter family protein [Fibrobacteraceae bacterium]|nr:threonine/serine exporter family protein [Fibrobacteraceae bacterium]